MRFARLERWALVLLLILTVSAEDYYGLLGVQRDADDQVLCLIESMPAHADRRKEALFVLDLAPLS